MSCISIVNFQKACSLIISLNKISNMIVIKNSNILLKFSLADSYSNNAKHN